MQGFDWQDEADRLLEEALETSLAEGINLIDTAPIYGFGRAEETIGRTLKRLACRSKVLLATKFGLEWDDNRQKVRRNSSKKQLMRELDKSRRRLQTDVIDIYQIHWPDRAAPWGETMDALLSFYEAGIIRAIGVSNFSVDQMKECLRYAPIHTCQPPYNLFEQDSAAEIIPFCREKGIGVLAYGGLCRGLLSGKFVEPPQFPQTDIRARDPKFSSRHFPQYHRALEALEEFARYKKTKLPQLSLSWVFHQPGVSAALAGARSRRQAAENAEAVAVSLSKEDLETIDQIIHRTISEPVPAGFLSPPEREPGE